MRVILVVPLCDLDKDALRAGRTWTFSRLRASDTKGVLLKRRRETEKYTQTRDAKAFQGHAPSSGCPCKGGRSTSLSHCFSRCHLLVWCWSWSREAHANRAWFIHKTHNIVNGVPAEGVTRSFLRWLSRFVTFCKTTGMLFPREMAFTY